jgi:hypothetical protein
MLKQLAMVIGAAATSSKNPRSKSTKLIRAIVVGLAPTVSGTVQ